MKLMFHNCTMCHYLVLNCNVFVTICDHECHIIHVVMDEITQFISHMYHEPWLFVFKKSISLAMWRAIVNQQHPPQCTYQDGQCVW
jgi:hypothetical protein